MTENEQLRADVEQFMLRLSPQWFLDQNWFPPSMVGRNFYARPIENPLHCQHCGGNGKEPSGKTMNGILCVCNHCCGSGRAADVSPVPKILHATEQCPECAGTGYEDQNGARIAIQRKVCDTCHGNGFVKIKQDKMTHG